LHIHGQGFVVRELRSVENSPQPTEAVMAAGTVSFVSDNVSNRLIRHKNFLAELEVIASELDQFDASFKTHPALSETSPARGFVSYESVNRQNHFLRHQNFRLTLQPRPAGGPEQRQFDLDASFVIIPGRGNPAKSSFRSVNFNSRVLRHRDFHLFLDEEASLSNDVARKDATFEIIDGKK
jgi:hypothetical protein